MKIYSNLALLICPLLFINNWHGTFLNSAIETERTFVQCVSDTLPPIANCIAGSTTVSLPASGCIIIFAKDLDRGSYDDITPVNKLKFYLNGDRNKASIQICCSDFKVAGACDEYPLNLDLWVEDEQGNTAVCKTAVIIQDVLDVCACQSTGFSIKGYIGSTCNNRAESNLKLSGPNNYLRQTTGPFIRFYELLNGPYQLCIDQNENPLNGVTTADIVKIQRHILGIETFKNPIQLIAADVNANNFITAADITEIRRLILGIKSNFTKVPSWLFTPSDSLINPNRIPHSADLIKGCWDLNLNNSNIDSINFTSIKMGDVNCSAKLTEQINTESLESTSNFNLNYFSKSASDQFVNTTFFLDKKSNVQGIQFTLQFDPLLFDFDHIESGMINIQEEQISLRSLAEGKIHIAWDKNQLDKNNLLSGNLFSIIWKKKTHSNSSPVLSLNPRAVKPLLIDEHFNELSLSLRTSIIDTTPPVANCYAGIIVLQMPASQCVTLFIKDLERGSHDDITPYNKLKFYINGEQNKVSLQICCADFIAAQANHELQEDVQLWVEDEAGNTNSCTVKVIVQDNQDFCPGDPNLVTQVVGTLKTRLGLDVLATIQLTKDNLLYKQDSGYSYKFDIIPGKYFVCPKKDDNHLNGVSTADIVKIQRHILGISPLSHPYLLIAADVNKSNTITASDLTEIRKLVLGVTTRFAKVPSWIFIPKDTVFTSYSGSSFFIDYCKYFEAKLIANDTIDFTAVKMGDVTENAKAGNLNTIKTRNLNRRLSYHSANLEDHSTRTVFSLENEFDLAGLQFTLSFDPVEFEFITFENGNLKIEEDQYSLLDLDKGKIHFAWNRDPLKKESKSSTNLFSILWKKKSNIATSPLLNFDLSNVTPLFIDNNLDEYDLNLIEVNSDQVNNIHIIPDLKNKIIYLQSSNESELNIECSLLDLNGRMIFHKSLILHPGNKREGILFERLPENGMYLLSVHAGFYSGISKLLILK